MSEETALLALLALLGVVAGFINTMAGGGSLLTLPMLMLLGLPADVANGTNRLSIVTQSISGSLLFHKEDKIDRPALLRVLAPTATGSLLGALLASRAPAAVLEPVLLGTMIVIALLIAFRPALVTAEEGEEPRPVGGRAMLALFAAGIYGGFIQAGVGFVLLSVLGALLRYDLVRANALKLVCTTVFGVVALAVFVVAGQVAWIPAVVLAVATVVGSQLGVRFALRVEQRVLRRILLICVVAFCVAVALRR